MAQIDLKNCVVFLQDGYAGPAAIGTGAVNKPATTGIGNGLVNNASGYPAGATTMAVDGFSGAVVTGDVFLVAGDGVYHKITAHTETLGATTSVTFTPALGAAVTDDAALTLTGGYIGGTTTIAVDGFTGAVVTGDRFTIAGELDAHGDLVAHTITAHAETLGATTSITFTPSIATAATSFIADDAALAFLPHLLKIRIGDGNISWTEKRPIVYVKDRGLLDTVRLGDQEPVEVKFDLTWIFLSSASGDTAPTPEEFLKQSGLAANYVSSSADPCEPYATDIVVVYTPPCSQPIETYLLHDFRYEDLGQDIKQGMIAVTGKCNVFQISAFRSPT